MFFSLVEHCNLGKEGFSLHLETTTTATTLSAGRVGGGRGDVLDAANLHAGAGEGAEGGLGAGAGGLGGVTAGGADLDVQGVDAELLAAGSDVLRGQHGGVGGGLVAIGLDLHAAGDTGDGFAATEIGNVDEGIVEGGKDTGNAKDELAITDGRTEGDVLLGSAGSLLGGSHCELEFWW